ncbi:replication restart DNA helicase PriA [Haloechinothrix alba]|uniref:Probable replication restart protein PriA n=1 Tax=Haloechinothrix alba TaxID=664784 RepID=A0A238WXP8_9PSEU|nr:primosomal protein N' [Haloechinothrix alba]SNR51307.1 replication restart DNA helicase PriA [Haloechinothrix alba]
MGTSSGVRKGQRRPAGTAPVARVYVDVPLAHLDRTFDYLVPHTLEDSARPGCRVRVRFAGQLVDGYVAERADSSEHTGRLAYLERVVSDEPVLTPELARLARAVADRYAGTMADVLRLAIPPRHARVERETPPEPAEPPAAPSTEGWRRYTHGSALVAALAAGKRAHAVWQALPGEDWPARLAELAGSTAATGRSTLIVVPDHRDLARVRERCADLAGPAAVVALSADLGPAERYRRWLRVRRGHARIVVGTRAAMFAPVSEPGAFVVWDDGDDLHAERRAPYPHVRDVLIQRAHASGAGMVVAGFARTAEAQLLVESEWARPVLASRERVRASAPRTIGSGDEFELARDPAAGAARLPATAFDAARTALASGTPVLVQVPRSGYVPALACARCRHPARCRSCAGPLAVPGGTAETAPTSAHCRWCGAIESNFSCPTCGPSGMRAVVVGARRTAEELGRAFPGKPVRTSGGSEVLDVVPGEPAVVVCTPGAEPVAHGGYGAALLLDGWALLSRQDLRAGEETVRRWMSAAALVRSAGDGGRVVVGADAALAQVQAMVRWDPAWYAERELAERAELGFPPAVRMASVQARADVLADLLLELPLPDAAEVLGPVPVTPERAGEDAEIERALIRVPRDEGRALAGSLSAAQARRSARKAREAVRIQLDPLELV